MVMYAGAGPMTVVLAKQASSGTNFPLLCISTYDTHSRDVPANTSADVHAA